MASHSHFRAKIGPAPLAIRIDPLREGLVRVSPAGEVDLSTAAQLRDSLLGAIRDLGPERLEVDLVDVSFLDSTGVSVLLAAEAAAKAADCQLAVVNPQPRVRRVLSITAVLDRLGVPPEA
jgi:anti-sigma B factor antagonist